MQDIFQIMGSSWDDWEPRDPAKWHNWNYRQNQDDWQEQGNNQKTGSNNSWQNKDWVVVNKNKHIQDRIDARNEKQKKQAEKAADFPGDSFTQWQTGIKAANAWARTRSSSEPPSGKAQKKGPPPNAQQQALAEMDPFEVLKHSVARCQAQVPALTSHSERPGGSGASCSNIANYLEMRGICADTPPHLARTSHSDGPWEAANHWGNWDNQDDVDNQDDWSEKDNWEDRDLGLFQGAGGAAQNLSPEGSYQCWTCGVWYPVQSCLANLWSPDFAEFMDRGRAQSMLDRFTCEHGQHQHPQGLDILTRRPDFTAWSDVEESSATDEDLSKECRAMKIVRHKLDYISLYRPGRYVRSCCFFCAGKHMFNDPWHFVNNKSHRHLKNSWKHQSERSKFVVKGNKHLKEVEHLKKALEAQHHKYMLEEGEYAVPTVLYKHLITALKESTSLALAADWQIFFGPSHLGMALIYGIPNENWEVVFHDRRNLQAMSSMSREGINLDTSGFYPLGHNEWYLLQPNLEAGHPASKAGYKIESSSKTYHTAWYSPISLKKYEHGSMSGYRLLTLGVDETGTKCICGYVGNISSEQENHFKTLSAANLLQTIWMLDKSGDPVNVKVTDDLILKALRYLYDQAYKVFGKVKNCKTLFTVDPETTTLKDSHHVICHDEALSIGVAGRQVKGLVIDQDLTPTWDRQVIEAMLEWVSGFFDFESGAFEATRPGPATKRSIRYFKEKQNKMHARLAIMDVTKLNLSDSPVSDTTSM